MAHEAIGIGGWIVNGFHAWVGLWIWVGVVVLHGLLGRSMLRSDPDPVRPSGPID